MLEVVSKYWALVVGACGLIGSWYVSNYKLNKCQKQTEKNQEQIESLIKITSEITSDVRLLTNNQTMTQKSLEENKEEDKKTVDRINEIAQGLVKVETKVDQLTPKKQHG